MVRTSRGDTDQVSQSRPTDYRDLLAMHEIVCSMSAKGCCRDNAMVASFFFPLKQELDCDGDHEVLVALQQLMRDLAFWINGDGNRARCHSPFGYLGPIDDEQQSTVARTLTPAEP
jgi:transposase InsO family protein